MGKSSAPNPLKPLSLPSLALAGLAAALALSLLLRAAPAAMSSLVARNVSEMAVASILLGLALAFAALGIRTGVRLPERAIVFQDLESIYDVRELEALLVSGENPNTRFLSTPGKWLARISDAFARLPTPYQRLSEVAILALLFVAVAVVLGGVVSLYVRAGGRPDLARAALSWLTAALVVLGYAYWVSWPRRLWEINSREFPETWKVAVGTMCILALVNVLAAVTRMLDLSLPPAPSLQPVSSILVAGSAAVILLIFGLVWLRSRDLKDDMGLPRSRGRVNAFGHIVCCITWTIPCGSCGKRAERVFQGTCGRRRGVHRPGSFHRGPAVRVRPMPLLEAEG